MHRTAFLLFIVASPFLSTVKAHAQAPQTIVYQGALTNAAGSPIQGSQSIRFSIYADTTTGTALWTETHTLTPDGNGVFTVELGTLHPLDATVFNGSRRFLGIRVGADTEMRPRQVLTAAAYAINAQNIPDGSVTTARLAESAVTSAKITNGTILLEDLGANGALPGQVIKWNGTTWAPAADQAGAGGITSVTGFGGLTGGGSSGDLFLSIQDQGVTTPKLADGSVTAQKLARGNVGSPELADTGVQTVDIADGAVTAAKIRGGAVGTVQIQDGAVTAAKIAGQSVEINGRIHILNPSNNLRIHLNKTVSDVGQIGLYNSQNQLGAFFQGDGVKSFLVQDPVNPNQTIRYVCMEGPEPGIYSRGTTALSDGRAHVTFSDHFSALAVSSSITVSLTPRSAESQGLAVVSVSTTGMDVVECRGGAGTYSFDWIAYARRTGFEDFKVYLSRDDLERLVGEVPPR